MTDEYIRRVEAEEAIEEYCCRMCKEYSEVEGGCVSHAQHCEHLSGEEILKPVKSADVQPVKYGEWETWGYIFHGIEWVRCSRCGKPADVSYFKLLEGKIEPATLSICGCCGADMRGDGNA